MTVLHASATLTRSPAWFWKARYLAACAGRGAGLMFLVLATVLVSLVTVPADGDAASPMIRMPFRNGTSWMVTQGYNTSPADGGSHWNCDPETLRDEPSQTTSCRSGWQYRYSLDLHRPSGNSVGEPVVSPVEGTIRWIDEATGGMSINLGNGYAVAFFHATLEPGLAAGQPVQMGQLLGTVAPAGEAGNKGFPHIHLAVWETDDGGNWSRNAIPFAGEAALDGYDLPDKGDAETDQYYSTMLYSSNVVLGVGPDGIPGAPAPQQPTSSATTGNPVAFSWTSVEGATGYQVVVDGTIFSEWTSATSLSMTLKEGDHTWRVRARNDHGTGNLSATRTLTVSASGTTSGPTVTISDSSGEVGETFTVGGSGFAPGDTATIRWRSQVLRSLTVPASGSFSTPITIPQAPNGTWPITVSTDAGDATTSFRVIASLERDPIQVAPGETVRITVNGFEANERVDLRWRSDDGPVFASVTTNASGSGSTSVSLPDAPGGWSDYNGEGQSSNLRAWGAINVQPSVSLSDATTLPGAEVTVDARGFPASTSATVRIAGDGPGTSTTLCTISTAPDGRGRCDFEVPNLPTGGYVISVASANGTTSETTLTIEGPPSITVSPDHAAAGTQIVVRVGGFEASESIVVTWDNQSAWRSVTTDGHGNATIEGTVPQLPVGSATLSATSMSGSTDAVASFEVAAQPDPGATTMTGPGTYTVVATRQGMVGTSTSSGHIIVPDDHFVSLPACTATSCAWYAPGKVDERWGIRTECGDKCYVMVINEDTGSCEVAPILDVGPWFTVDDWWNPGEVRYLNQLDTNPNYLAQGVTGAGAARNGLDVGYGIGPNGIGSSNRYATVGNAAVIDLADGTWTAIGLEFDKGIDVIDVELLWQTGQDPEAAAAECGHPLVQGGNTGDLSLSETQGEVGSQVQVEGGDFRAGEAVRLHVGSTDTPQVASTTASDDGSISVTITVPDTPYGVSKIIARGVGSGTIQESTFSITPSIEREPTSGSPGATITITVHGYGANENVELWWDDRNGDDLGSLRTNASGTGSTVITLPDGRGSGWKTYYARGVTSGAGAFGAVNIIGGSTSTPTPSPSDVDPAIQALVDALIKVLMEVLAQIASSPVNTTMAVATTTEVHPGSDPSFDGQPLPIAAISTSVSPAGQESGDPNLMIDGDPETAWATAGGSPERAMVTLDLGLLQSVSGVRWLYNQSVGVDQQITQVSVDGENWTQLVITTGRQPQQWDGVAVDQDVRFVRLVLTNDAGLPVLGYLAEVEVWGATAPQARVAIAPASNESDNAPRTGYVANTSGANLNCRATPANDGEVVGTLAPGDAVTITGDAQDGWLPVQCGGTTGWVAGTFISDAPAESAGESSGEPNAAGGSVGVEGDSTTSEDGAKVTPTPTPEPVPQAREVVVAVSADVSVNSIDPDAGEDPPGGGALFLGGPDGETAALTFDIPSLDGGDITSAKLVVQGAGDAGSGGPVYIIAGARIDGGSAWNTLQGMIDSSAASLGWIDDGVETSIDVTGWIPAEGAVTVILPGTPDQRVMIASLESGAPAYLVLTVEG